MSNTKTTKELYEKLIQMSDLHSIPELDGEFLIWKLYKNAYVRACCDSYDTCIDIIDNSVLVGSLIHWHPDEEDMLEELYSLGQKGNILVLRKFLGGVETYYIGKPGEYRFSAKKKWHWGRLIYLKQK